MFLFNRSNINEGVNTYRNTPDALLVDVREKGEFRKGHIPGAINIPLSSIETAELPADLSTPLFIYCLAGTRCQTACEYLKSRGYKNVRNIGGIKMWKGEVIV